MPMYFYGDITIDNHEFQFGEETLEAYKEALRLGSEVLLPGVGPRLQNRYVASVVGGVYLIAKHSAVATSLWRWVSSETVKRNQELNGLEPWENLYRELATLQQRISTSGDDFKDVLRLFYRVSRFEDGAYRTSAEVHDGFVLPSTSTEKKLNFPTLPGEGDTFPRVKLDAPVRVRNDTSTAETGDTSNKATIVINDAAIALRYRNPNWIDKEEWSAKSGSPTTSVSAIVKCLEPLKLHKGKLSNDTLLSTLSKKLNGSVLVIVNAEYLRLGGAIISSSLSWDSTVRDAVEQLQKRFLDRIESPPSHLVVTFGYDAALYLRVEHGKFERALLVFSVNRGEEEFASKYSGDMPGAQSAFSAVLSSLIHQSDEWPNEKNLQDRCEIEAFLTYALIAKQRMLACGFAPLQPSGIFKNNQVSQEEHSDPVWAWPELMHHEAIFALPPTAATRTSADSVPSPSFPSAQADDPLVREHVFRHPIDEKVSCDHPFGDWSTLAPVPASLLRAQKTYGLSSITLDKSWLLSGDTSTEFVDVILDAVHEHLKDTREDPAKPFVDYVRTETLEFVSGEQNVEVPLRICQIGKIKTISAKEIESLRTVRRILHSYLIDRGRGRNPLGIAVFGRPGAGKSFTVKSIFETLQGEARQLTKGENFIECNLSGLGGPEDLASYFQRAQDIRLEGGVPVLFFDEFDCTVDGQKYYWLKHFLAPLQDGKFVSGHTAHPIGKSIFVFAGGTSASFDAFRRIFERSNPKDEALSLAKGPDFLSRLQAHINVEGLSKVDERTGEVTNIPMTELFETRGNRRYALRRAILLREMLRVRAKGIFRGNGAAARAEIDQNVVKAFLCTNQFAHGVRSIEAVIRMSKLGSGRFSADCLPPVEQLEMHIGRGEARMFHDIANGLA